MFNKAQYEAIARVIKNQRRDTNDALSVGVLTVADAVSAQGAISALQHKLIQLFEQDNPKFRKLVFIGACGEDSAESIRS